MYRIREFSEHVKAGKTCRNTREEKTNCGIVFEKVAMPVKSSVETPKYASKSRSNMHLIEC